MATQETLSAAKRDVSGTTASKRLRREGIVPAVVYGSKQREYMIQVDAKEFGNIFREQSSSNFLVNLEIDGAEEKTKLAMVQDVQQNPLNGSFIHIDFHAVNENETVHASVPITLTGESAGVKGGGLLDQLLHSIDVECRPADLPERIEYDVTELNVNESIHISDLVIPEGVTIGMDGEVVVANCNEARIATEEEEAADIGAGAAEPEVINEKSADEGE